MSKRILWDFEGVICDSAKEAFRVGATASGIISAVEDISFDENYADFLKWRGIVGPAWNYYHVFRAMYSGTASRDWVKCSKATAFERRFLEVRREIKSSNYLLWLNLHDFYEPTVRLITQYASDYEHIVVTNKNKEAVIDLIEAANLSSTLTNVISLFGRKVTKSTVIADLNPQPRDLFVDDHLPTIRQCFDSGLGDELQLIHAAWGYGDAEDSFTVSQDELAAILSGGCDGF